MEIEINELRALLSRDEPGISYDHRAVCTDMGQNIVVLDRGFVYVGNVEDCGDRIKITNAKNIRLWGTTKGLGELTAGPTKDTEIDEVGTVVAYKHAVIHLIPCKGF